MDDNCLHCRRCHGREHNTNNMNYYKIKNKQDEASQVKSKRKNQLTGRSANLCASHNKEEESGGSGLHPSPVFMYRRH